MPITLNGDTGITTPSYGGADTAEYLVPVTGFKNRIINGAMVIDQRNAGAEINPAVNATYYLDRWVVGQLVSGKFKIGQNAGSVTPPAGFTNYLGCTSLSSYSVGAGDYLGVSQKLEGFNVADLDWGTANAKTVNLSFWVRSSLTGTFSGSILNSASDRSYIFSYAIPVANAWTNISVSIVGDTSGTWLKTNGTGIEVFFNLGSGSGYNTSAGVWQGAGYRGVNGNTSVVGTNGATFYITGVQLEVGTAATSFDYRPYGTELALCQRYYFKNGGANQYVRIGTGPANTTTAALITVFMQTPMRTIPSSVTQTGVFGVWGGATVYATTGITLDTTSTSPYTTTLNAVVASGLTTGTTYQLIGNNDGTASIALSAEL